MAQAKTNFGAVPTGLGIKFPDDKRNWYVSGDGRAFTFEADQETKIWCTPRFDQRVTCIHARA